MQARGPLMIEHRLIERMLRIVEKKLDEITKTGKVDPLFIDKTVDFIRTYADRTHHGKEEDIMFRDLDKKKLSDDDREIMNELIEEHVFSRQTTKALMEANSRYRSGESGALEDIKKNLRTLVNFYPKHIEKEDKVFFPISREYLSESEEQEMLSEFRSFDQRMIHEKYKSLADELEA